MRSIAPFLQVALLLSLSQNSHALLLTLDTLAGNDEGFSFPRIHNANQAPLGLETDNGLVTFFRDGVGPTVTVVDAVVADVTTTSITFVSGTLRLGDGSALPDFVITGGEISFLGVGENEFAGTLETTQYGTFSVLNRIWIPTATVYTPNSFSPGSSGGEIGGGGDGSPGYLALWANNWNRGAGPAEGSPWGIDLVFLFDAVSDADPDPNPPVIIPEPSVAWLLGLGLTSLGTSRLRRPRPSSKGPLS